MAKSSKPITPASKKSVKSAASKSGGSSNKKVSAARNSSKAIGKSSTVTKSPSKGSKKSSAVKGPVAGATSKASPVKNGNTISTGKKADQGKAAVKAVPKKIAVVPAKQIKAAKDIALNGQAKDVKMNGKSTGAKTATATSKTPSSGKVAPAKGEKDAAPKPRPVPKSQQQYEEIEELPMPDTQDLAEPKEATKQKVQIEFLVRSAPTVLFELLSTPSGFAEWYCDDVNVRGDQYTFMWQGEEEPTTMIGRKLGEVIRFHRNDDDDENSYFEFRVRIDAMTNEVALIVTDHAWPEEVDETKNLWNSQIANLLRVLGA